MANRNILHKSKLDDFRTWLINDEWSINQPKGEYEVLRAVKNNKTIIIYTKLNVQEHYTVPENSYPIVKTYLKDKNK